MNREETDITAKNTLKVRMWKCATAVNKQLVAPEAELDGAKSAQARLADISSRSEVDATMVRAVLKRTEV